MTNVAPKTAMVTVPSGQGFIMVAARPTGANLDNGYFNISNKFTANCNNAANPDGSFTTDVAGTVEVQLINAESAFFNTAVIMQPTLPPGSPNPGPWPLTSCTAGNPIADCFFTTDYCTVANGCNAPIVGQSIDCTCQFNNVNTLGLFPAGTKFHTSLRVDNRGNGLGVDYSYFSDKSQNMPNDGYAHLRTTRVSPSGAGGFYRLEWEDGPSGGDQDHNDVVMLMNVIPSQAPQYGSQLATQADSCAGGGGPANTPPPLHILSNVTIDPQTVPQRRISLTQVLFNSGTSAVDVAVCSKLSFDKRKTGPGMYVPRATVQHKEFTYQSGNGNPDCAASTSMIAPSVRFTRQFAPGAPVCPGNNAFATVTPGDIVTVPGKNPTTGKPGSLGIFSQALISDIDAGITNVNDKLGPKSASDIKDELVAADQGLLADVFYEFSIGQDFLCVNGVNVELVDLPSCSVADHVGTIMKVTTVSVASPVTVPLPLHSTVGRSWTTNQDVILDVYWFDNLPTTLTGHLTVSPMGIRNPFVMTPDDGRNLVAQLHVDLPTVPDGFHGTAYIILSYVDGGVITANSIGFAKDDSPPSVLTASTVRDASHQVTAFVEASDPPPPIMGGLAQPAGLDELTLMPDAAPTTPQIMQWVNGDFRSATDFDGTVGPFSAGDAVGLMLHVNDAHGNSIDVSLPVANAGPDQSVPATGPGGASVNLSGSLSTGAGALTYAWSGPFGIASGVGPVVQCPVGTCIVDLTVEDSQGFTGTDQVIILVTTPGGACCLANDACLDSSNPTDCGTSGGSYQGENTVCLGMEACCDAAAGNCYMTDRTCCLANGDTPQGAGTACGSEPEACCLGDNTCQMLDPLCCANLDGATHGPGSICGGMEGCCEGDACYMADRACCLANSDTPHGPGTMCMAPEACCESDGTCVDQTPVDPLCCTSQGGVPLGPGRECSGTEACCSSIGGVCYMTDQSCCLVNSDAPQGAGTACATPEACCFSDNTCQMLDPLCCVEQGGTTHGQGSVCAGMEGCCDGDACYMADRSCCLANGDTPQGTGTACTVPQACCLQGGAVCFDIDPLCCAELGDDVQGEGSACRGDANGDGIDDACLQLGACCDAGSGLPGGATCSTTTMLDCRCPTCTWYEGRSCQELENDDLCLVNAIPTVSEWGLVIMTLLLLTGAKVYLGVR